jgi:hypothetical protein
MKKDSIIVLAWPQTPAKAIGRWYDAITELTGFLKNGYYSAGHAACVLINHANKDLRYFDFGRYHMPQKYGRARSMETDPALRIKTKPSFSEIGEIKNIQDILIELKANKACHGEGPLYASVLENVSFSKAFNYARSVQNEDAVPYGPYVINGTNCSRFIASVLKASLPGRRIKFRLSASLLLTPLTKANVLAVSQYYFKVTDNSIEQLPVTVVDLLQNFMLPLFQFQSFLWKKKKTSSNNQNTIELDYLINEEKMSIINNQ